MTVLVGKNKRDLKFVNYFSKAIINAVLLYIKNTIESDIK